MVAREPARKVQRSVGLEIMLLDAPPQVLSAGVQAGSSDSASILKCTRSIEKR
jgi:hypothetical protein